MNRACFPQEKHQNSQKWAKFMSFSFWPFLCKALVWFAGATPENRDFLVTWFGTPSEAIVVDYYSDFAMGLGLPA